MVVFSFTNTGEAKTEELNINLKICRVALKRLQSGESGKNSLPGDEIEKSDKGKKLAECEILCRQLGQRLEELEAILTLS